MSRLFVVVSVILLLIGCQAVKSNKSVVGSSSPDKELGRLLGDGKLDEAVRFVVSQEDFFAANYGHSDVRGATDRLAQELEIAYTPLLERELQRIESIAWPVPSTEWGRVQSALARSHKRLVKLIKKQPFEYRIYRPEKYDRVKAALKQKEAVVRASVSDEFSRYPLAADKSFFDIYPVPVDGGKVLKDNESRWMGALETMTASEASRFFAHYGPYLPRSAKEIMAQRYFNSLCPNPAKAELRDILSAFKQCQVAGLTPASIPGLKVAFLQVTSPDLIRHKTLDFPLSIKVDIPLEASKASMKKMFSHKAVKEADVVVLVNVALARAERVVESNKRVQSMYIHQYNQVENPDYSIVKTELEAATTQYHEMVASHSYTWGASLVEKFILQDDKVERVNAAKVRMEDLKIKMRNTPKYNRLPEYQPYVVNRAFLDIKKYGTVNYYIIDKRNHRYFRDTFDVKDKAFFTVCYGIHGRDKDPSKLLQTSVLEEDVVRYELEPVQVNLSDLLEQYASTPSSWMQYASMAPIHRSVAADVTHAQERFTATDFTYDKHADKRFESVVVVRNLGNNIGTGFYVSDELVLTNYHVVGETEYCRLKLFNEKEVMGRVVARDALSDLALIEADVKGRPVCFYDKRVLPLGIPLEIIGHPGGLQFTVTRGSLSSIRKGRSINYKTAKGQVLFLQTDAAVNGGNSGGPVFYGKYVVGVTDWGYVRMSDGRNAQGLNFAIHYSEVFKFLERHGVMACKGSR